MSQVGDRQVAASDLAQPIHDIPIPVPPLLQADALVYKVANYTGQAVRVMRVESFLQVVIATADSGVTIKNHAGTSLGTLTITESGCAIADRDSSGELAQSANNVIANGEDIQLAIDGAASAGEASFVIWVRPCIDSTP